MKVAGRYGTLVVASNFSTESPTLVTPVRRLTLTAAFLLWAIITSGNVVAQDEFADRRVVGLSFEGNTSIDDLTLSRSISTSNSSAFVRTWPLNLLPVGVTRFFDETEFRRDVLRLILLYRRSGFMDVVVDTVVQRSGRDVRIRFLIREGEPVTVISLSVTGVEGVLNVRRMLRDLPLRVGDNFDRFQLQAATDSIILYFQNHGFALVEVFRSFDIDRRRKAASVVFDVVPGPISRVGTINIQGHDRISEGLISRTLAVREGEIFRRADLFESQRNLYGLNVFNFVDVRIDSASLVRRDSTVNLDVRLSEGRMRTLRAGFGYGTVDCLRILAGVRLDNFLGDARSLDFTARMSKIGAPQLKNGLCRQLLKEDSTAAGRRRLQLNRVLSLSLRFPSFFSRNTRAVFTLSEERSSEFLAYLRKAVGGNLAVTRTFTKNVSATVSYDLSYGSTAAEPAIFCSILNACRVEDIAQFESRVLRSTLGISGTIDRSNSAINPTRGWRAVGEVRWASPLIGSGSLARFAKFVGEVTAYFRLSRNGVLAFRWRGGSIRSSELTAAGQDLRFIPIEERFYAGGPTSVRGFGQNELGPTVRVCRGDGCNIVGGDSVETTAATGGNAILLANAELRVTLPGFSRRLSAAFFVDAGRVFDRVSSAPSGDVDFRITPGIGIRFATPIGPIRIDVAYNPYDPGQSRRFTEEGTDLIEDLNPFLPDAPESFAKRLKLNFAVGQAF